MAVRRKIFTLTLIGLIAAFMFPLCASALETGEEVPTKLNVVQDNEYDATPTFTWTAVSGATSFDIKFGSTTPLNYVAGTTITDPTDATKKIWDEASLTGVLNTDGDYDYTYTPETALSPVGAVTSWEVVAKRAAGTKNADDPGFDGTDSTAKSDVAFSVFGNVVLSMTPDKTADVAPGDTVTVKVSLDNSAATAGGLALATLDFSVTYDNATLIEAPTTAKGVGRITTTPTFEAGTGKVTVKIAENIVAGAAEIVELAFKAKEGLTGGKITFGFADVAATSPVITKAAKVEVTSTATAETTILPDVKPGVIISGGDTPDLKDAVVSLKVAAGYSLENLGLVEAQKTALANYAKAKKGPIGVDDAVEILGMLAK